MTGPARCAARRKAISLRKNDALSQVRGEAAKFYPEMLKGSCYAFLKNPENLITKQDETLTRLCGYRLKTARAYLPFSPATPAAAASLLKQKNS